MPYSTYDLHCHSTASDGELAPADLVARAAANGVEVLALTDHDTVAGLAEAQSAAASHGIRLVNGVELSCLWGNYTVHILGLNFDVDEVAILEAERSQLAVRVERAEEIAARLVKKGFPCLLADAKSLTQSGIPGRPHFAEAMLRQGLVASQSEAFKKFLGAGKVGDVKSGWPDLEQVVNWIRDSGGDAVIAHPRKYDMSLTRLRELIGEFKDCGGAGIEVVVSGQKQGEIGMLADLCQRMDVKASVGSDFHTPRFAWAELGRVPVLPDSVVPIWSEWCQ